MVTPAASSLFHALLLDPSTAEQEWIKWRAGANLEELESDSLDAIPLLAGRLPEWLAEDPDREKLLGVCKRAWARNQVRFRELADVWTLLRDRGADPAAIGGCAAWALLYLEEKAVRPIASFQVLIRRDHAMAAKQALEGSGWTLEPGMPEPEGRVLDRYEGIWFRSPSQGALFLAWRLKKVSPEMAAENETAPSCRMCGLQGTAAPVLDTEELLFDAVTRDRETPVSWKCDAMMLLRNRRVNWKRFFDLSGANSLAAERLASLREEGAAIPPLPRARERRVHQFWIDYRQKAWSREEPHSRAGFVRYLIARGLSKNPLALTVIDASEAGGFAPAEYTRYRTLFFFLTLRDIRLRYRKTWRGVFWAIIQPLLPMLIFAAIFSRIIRPELRIGPYWLFVLAGLAPWDFFANAVNYSSLTFVNNFGLLNKVYFPRAILPAAAVSACLVDLFVSASAVIALAWFKGYAPSPHLLLLPLVFAAGTMVAGAAGLAAASLNVLDRDLKALVPFLVQVAMYAAPVLYPLELIPSALRRLLWLNPMTGVVEAFRSSLFAAPLDWTGEAISALAFCALAICAAVMYRRVEADLAERV